MTKKKINKELWSSFLKIYSASAVDGKFDKKIMLIAIFVVILINAAAICWVAIKNQTQDIEIMNELMQMMLLFVLSSGVVGFGMVKKSGISADKKAEENSDENKKGEK